MVQSPPVTILNVDDDAADQQQCLEAGFDRHLTKPVEPAELRQLLAAFP
jgi:CheY-like chemotaxis protein